jgi:carbamoyl-phosphate synthase large subunit
MKLLPKKVLILGAGGLKTGQTGEFDYSGFQAIKAFHEEGIKTILINPNIATVQTSEGMADSTYFLPVTPEFVRKVIEKEKPDAILLSFGGQTALNCGVALEKDGTLASLGVKVLGTPVKSIEDTEDCQLLKNRLNEIGALCPHSFFVTDISSALAAASEIGYPVMARITFTRRGAGSGICRNESELTRRCSLAFSKKSEITGARQILVEEWLGGWKEIEFEIIRDSYDNCITVASMENFDPLGIHTRESIVVSPAQTLTDSEFSKLRRAGIDVIRHLGITGECNIKFALDPFSEDYRIIKVNTRHSRSSAFASKATGYPLAFIAAKMALGYSLLEIENRITLSTKACFEPALDYIAVKVPRWEIVKFQNIEECTGSEMKFVGESMAIARTFEEAIQKALRMTSIGAPGLAGDDALCGSSFQKPGNITKKISNALSKPADRRIFAIYRALYEGLSVGKIYRITKIDKWFLNKLAAVCKMEKQLRSLKPKKLSGKADIKSSLLLHAKRLGFSDARLGDFSGLSEMDIRKMRAEYLIRPAIKQIDTLAGEYAAKNNYLYMTYGSANAPEKVIHTDDVNPSGRGVMLLGSGAYRIDASLEFDWCCVNAMQTVRKSGRYSIMVNCNPETVSTDYDMCDRLYFEELTLERILDIYERENPDGIIVSMSGQVPNNLVTKLLAAGVHIYGTTPQSIDMIEDGHKFSALLDKLGIEKSLNLAENIPPEHHPVVISGFYENSKEIEINAVACKGEIIFSAITEHIENAGVHSADATVVFPAQRLYVKTMHKMKKICEKIAKALDITGPFNIQFLAQGNNIKVIKCNLRVSRNFPFCSKVSRVNMVEMAVKAILGDPVQKTEFSALDYEYVGVKTAPFSFARLHGVDPVSTMEMANTGEVGCIGTNLSDAFLKVFLSIGYKIPAEKAKILLSTGPIKNKLDFLNSAHKLINMGHELYASKGTAKFLAANNIPATLLYCPLERRKPNIADFIKNRKIDIIINIPKNNLKFELKNNYKIRRMAIDFDIPLFTNIKIAREFINALETLHNGTALEIKSWEEYR